MDKLITPEIRETIRRLGPGFLAIGAHMDSIFPPESPTSKRRGGNKLALSDQAKFAVGAILDAMNGNPWDFHTEFAAAMTTADAEFFRTMAEAADYVRDMPRPLSIFARHIIAAQRIASEMTPPEGPLPSWREIRRRVSVELGQAAYGDKSGEWSRVKAAANLGSFPL